MTKYILAGGNDRDYDDFGPALAAEIYKTASKPLRLVSCFFASPDQDWQTTGENWGTWFKTFLGDDLTYSFVTETSFVEQVQQCDVLYFHGGDSNEALIETMDRIKDSIDAFRGKVVIGSSAGANYLSQAFWARTKAEFGIGAGILPLGVMVHYKTGDEKFNPGDMVDWGKAEAAVRKQIPANFPLLKLAEGQFDVFWA